MNKLDRKTIFILTLRTFFIRLFYNYNNLFGEGLCYCMLPFFRKKPDSCMAGEDIINRHLKFFNTSEYMSGFALGIILKNENRVENELDRTKDILSSVLGSIGDRLVYRLIVPIMVLAVLNKFALSGFRPDICTVSFIVSVIILFNIFNFSIRYYGIASGFEKGIESLKIFKTPGYFRIVRFLIVCRNILAAALIVNLIINAEAGNILLFFYD